jgi:hypothetical protein
VRSRNLLLFAVIAAFAVGAALATGVIGVGPGHNDSGQGATGYVREHSVDVPTSARTVSVSADMPMPSSHARMLSAMLIEGRLPDAPMMAKVMTDTDCAPDAQMISRCRNEVQLANGEKIVVRHPHDMRDVPCLAPGELVRLVPTT